MCRDGTVGRYFNPRSREGSDAFLLAVLAVKDVDFNPRSREGSDVRNPCPCQHLINFNPRSREGSDKSIDISFYFFSNFNPRSREGSDSNFRQNVSLIFIINKQNFFFLLFYYTNSIPYSTSSVHIFRCESPCSLMSAYHSHLFTGSGFHLLQFLSLPQCAPLLSYIYFPDNKNADYRHFHQ